MLFILIDLYFNIIILLYIILWLIMRNILYKFFYFIYVYTIKKNQVGRGLMAVAGILMSLMS